MFAVIIAFEDTRGVLEKTGFVRRYCVCRKGDSGDGQVLGISLNASSKNGDHHEQNL